MRARVRPSSLQGSSTLTSMRLTYLIRVGVRWMREDDEAEQHLRRQSPDVEALVQEGVHPPEGRHEADKPHSQSTVTPVHTFCQRTSLRVRKIRRLSPPRPFVAVMALTHHGRYQSRSVKL